MAKPTEPLGRLELDVLRYIAERGPITVRDVAGHFAATSGQARTTVLTVMKRLRGKGYLTRRKVRGVHRYAPTIAIGELLNRLLREFVDEVLEGSVSPFVAYLARSPHLNDDEVRKLSQILKRMESREQKDKS